MNQLKDEQAFHRFSMVLMTLLAMYPRTFSRWRYCSVGETRIPLIALASSGALNVVLNLFFVAVLHMTVNGVAIATVISNAVSSALLYCKLRRTKLNIHLDPKLLRVDKEILKPILRIGLPAGIQSSVFSISNIVIQSAINSLALHSILKLSHMIF